MAMPDFIKKKIAAKAGEEASASDEDASASESASDTEAPVKKGGKKNPLMMWAAKNK